MPNVAVVLKNEIERVFRKHTKGALQELQHKFRAQRGAVAALRKRVLVLERAVRSLAGPARASPRSEKKTPSEEAATAAATSLRWRPAGFASHRQRLGLTKSQMARLIGASELSVHKWETGQARPRVEKLKAIDRVRHLSKAQARQELAAAST